MVPGKLAIFHFRPNDRLRERNSRLIYTHPFVVCITILAYNGTKMILFGGNTDTTQSVDSLYILDVPSMTWTQADSSLDARSDMACSVSGDNFIVWGGKSFLYLLLSVQGCSIFSHHH